MADEDVIFEVHECLPCAICGHTVHYEFSVPNSVWNAVMRQDGHETDAEYICLSCFFTVLTTAITALQAENERLTKQLDEAEADAERFDRRRIQCNDMEEFRCVFCGKLQNEDYSWEKDETDELHCKDCIHILHRERLSRK